MSTIMVIEEDSAMRVLISEWLASEGHQVRAMARHAEAGDATVDLVILDLPQPRARASETARAVEAVHAAFPRSSVIGMSTHFLHSLGNDSDAARALGVSRLLAKPCTREELLVAVAATL